MEQGELRLQCKAGKKKKYRPVYSLGACGHTHIFSTVAV
jgi:hypothetical protein